VTLVDTIDQFQVAQFVEQEAVAEAHQRKHLVLQELFFFLQHLITALVDTAR
jgi:hypothetical protein